jgi:hypothetical protein
MFSACNPHSAHDTMQTDLTRHEAKEASWSVLRVELTRQAEHMRHLKAGHAHATAELNILHKCFEGIEVLREEIHALECGAASADELREPVVRLEGS